MNTIGIRRETKNKWERRAPLTPDHLAAVRRTSECDVVVQPSPRRVFGDSQYQRAGARLSSRLDDCDVILGVKAIEPAEVIPEKTYVFFSHVTKGQGADDPLLRRILEARCTLIDYERITDANGRCLVYSGRHAGYAGMIDTLWALGRRLQYEWMRTPLREIKLAHEYESLDQAMVQIQRVGHSIRERGLPLGLRPIVFAIAGSGHVAEGARRILGLLPTVEIEPEDLPGLPENRDVRRHVVFCTHLQKHHRYERSLDQRFDGEDFLRHPWQYSSALRPLLRHTTVLVNGIYWEPRFPRLVGNDDLNELWREERQPKLRVIGDISCDVGGSIEATMSATTPDDPVYVYDCASNSIRPGVEGRGPVIMSVDNLPAEIPAESSEFISASLMKFLPELIHCDWNAPLSGLSISDSLRRAVVVHRGRLTPLYAHLGAHIPLNSIRRDAAVQQSPG